MDFKTLLKCNDSDTVSMMMMMMMIIMIPLTSCTSRRLCRTALATSESQVSILYRSPFISPIRLWESVLDTITVKLCV